MSKRIGLILMLVIVLMFSGMSFAESQDEIDQEFTLFDLKLKDPELVPQAVQIAMLYIDPVTDFKNRVMFNHTKDVSRGYDRLFEIENDWNTNFNSIRGNLLYLLTIAPMTGDFPNNSKTWLTTKTVRIDDKPVCWCVPLEGKKGKRYQVILSKENRIDLEKIYNEIISRLNK